MKKHLGLINVEIFITMTAIVSIRLTSDQLAKAPFLIPEKAVNVECHGEIFGLTKNDLLPVQ